MPGGLANWELWEWARSVSAAVAICGVEFSVTFLLNFVLFSEPASVDLLDQQHLFVVIDFAQFHFDDFTTRGLHLASYEAGFNGQFAMTAIDQRQQLHATGAAMTEERVESGPDGTTCIQHVIDQNDVA